MIDPNTVNRFFEQPILNSPYDYPLQHWELDDGDLRNVKGEIGKLNERQIIQLEHSRSDTEYQDESLISEMNSLEYPLHFIDFETSTMAVPYHAGMRPYENVAFQWSCHTIETSGAAPKHSEWINTVDAFPNFEFARSLFEHLGYDGSALMWWPHENTILKDIRRQMRERNFPDEELGMDREDGYVRGETRGYVRLV